MDLWAPCFGINSRVNPVLVFLLAQIGQITVHFWGCSNSAQRAHRGPNNWVSILFQALFTNLRTALYSRDSGELVTCSSGQIFLDKQMVLDKTGMVFAPNGVQFAKASITNALGY